MSNNKGVRFGIYAGISVVGLYLLLYLIKGELFFNPFVYWATVGIYLAFGWKALEDERQAVGGRLPLADGLKLAFLIFVIANLLYYLFYYLMFKLIDPSLVELQRETGLETLEQWKDSLPDEQYRERKRLLEEKGLEVKLQDIALQYARSLLGYFIMALIMAGGGGRR
jgi:hypothetical protein